MSDPIGWTFFSIAVLIAVTSTIIAYKFKRRHGPDTDFEVSEYSHIPRGDAYVYGTPKACEKIGCFILEDEDNELLIQAHNVRKKGDKNTPPFNTIQELVEQDKPVYLRIHTRKEHDELYIEAQYSFTQDSKAPLAGSIIMWSVPVIISIIALAILQQLI